MAERVINLYERNKTYAFLEIKFMIDMQVASFSQILLHIGYILQDMHLT